MIINNTKYLGVMEMVQVLRVCYNTFNKWVSEGKITLAFINPSGRKFSTHGQVDAYFDGEYFTQEKSQKS